MGLPFEARRPLSESEEEETATRARKRARPPPPSVEEKRARFQALWEEFAHAEAYFRLLEEFNSVSYGVPASKKAVVRLYMPLWVETVEDDCAICLEGLELGQKFRRVPCGHTFHQRCIFRWLLINRLCPVCQFPMPCDDEQRRLDDAEAARAHQDAGSKPATEII